jgi:hypothetical protein
MAESFRTSQLHRLLERFRAGDRAAWEEMHCHVGARLEALARRMLRGFPEVRRFEATPDVLQNATVRLLRALATGGKGAEACKNAYTGRLTRAGTVPLPAWPAIKRPYRELMTFLLSSPVHVLICGRQGNDFAEDQDTGELKNLGYKMRAEGETAYEPDLLLRLEAVKAGRKRAVVVTAHVEKDRTGILAGQSIAWPTFDNIARPLLGLLGPTQAVVPSDDEVGQRDAEAMARYELDRQQRSAELAATYTTVFDQADSVVALERFGKELTPQVKGQLASTDLDRVRKAYAARLGQLKAEDRGIVSADGPTGQATSNGTEAKP